MEQVILPLLPKVRWKKHDEFGIRNKKGSCVQTVGVTNNTQDLIDQIVMDVRGAAHLNISSTEIEADGWDLNRDGLNMSVQGREIGLLNFLVDN